jgi:riboflavin kinase/FMN adenylyltransferase
VRVVHAGRTHQAVLNIGFRPTLQDPKPQLHVEAHLLGFEGKLYGEELEVIFVEKLRDEKKFASVDELKAQIARDIAEAKMKF